MPWYPASLILLTLAGGGLRFYGLGHRDFWFDESCTFRYVHNLFNWPQDSNLLVESTNLPYYAALRGWVALFGSSESSFRSLSALAATLTIPILALLARRIAGWPAGLICALLAAFHPLHVHYAHEARAYALWILCLTGAIYLLVVAARKRRPIDWVLYGLCALFCLYVHYFTIFVLPWTAACVLLSEERRKVAVQWTVTTILVTLGFLPYFLAAVWPASRQGGGAWITPYWDPALAILRTLWAFMPAGGYPQHLRGLSIASSDTVVLGPAWLTAVTRTLPAVLVVALIVTLLWNVRASSGNRKPATSGRLHLFLGCMTLGPLVLAFLYSLLVRPIYLVGRYDMVAWPGFVIWLAVAISAAAPCSLLINVAAAPRGGRGVPKNKACEGQIGIIQQTATGAAIVRGILVYAACALMIACSLLPIARMAALKPPPTFHNLRAQRLARLCHPGDLVITFSYDRDYLSYYLFRSGFSGAIESFPSWLDRQVGWVDTNADLAPQRRQELLGDAQMRIKQIRGVLHAGGNVYVLGDYVVHAGSPDRAPIVEMFKKAIDGAGLHTETVDKDLMILRVTPA